MHAVLGMRPMMGASRFVEAGTWSAGPWWFAHAAFVLMVLAGLTILVWALMRKTRSGARPLPAVSAVDAASAIARERLARGEIEPDQYLAIVAALNGHYGVAQPPTPPESTSLDG